MKFDPEAAVHLGNLQHPLFPAPPICSATLRRTPSDLLQESDLSCLEVFGVKSIVSIVSSILGS